MSERDAKGDQIRYFFFKVWCSGNQNAGSAKRGVWQQAKNLHAAVARSTFPSRQNRSIDQGLGISQSLLIKSCS